MARQQPLAAIRNGLKAEIGDSLEIGTANDKTYNQLLANMEMWLASEYDWPFLELRTDVPMVAGTRYYTMPTTYNQDRPIFAECKFNTYWHKLELGIGSREYNAFDSERGIKADPVYRWRQTNDGQFEVWPLPASNVQTIRLTGQQQILPLVEDADLADLDDQLLILFVAAEILSRSDMKDATTKMQKAQDRFLKLRGTSLQRNDPIVIGRIDSEAILHRRNVPIVVVH